VVEGVVVDGVDVDGVVVVDLLAFFLLPVVVVSGVPLVVPVVSVVVVVALESGTGLVGAVPGVWLGVVDWSVEGGTVVVCIGAVDGDVLGAGVVCAIAAPASKVTEPKPAMIVVVIFT
jgi:hypothetical protein